MTVMILYSIDDGQHIDDGQQPSGTTESVIRAHQHHNPYDRDDGCNRPTFDL